MAAARLLMALLALHSLAAAAEPAPDTAWRIWLDPKSMHAPLATAIPGAQRTVLAGGFLDDDGLSYYSKEDFASLTTSEADFGKRAKENAETDLHTLKPTYVRNRKKVIEYAELHSDRPIVASAVLAGSFLKLFKDTLGEKVLLIVPNRFTAYVFPALAGNHEDYAPMIITAYHETAWPVSTEVLEVSAHGIRSVGLFEEP